MKRFLVAIGLTTLCLALPASAQMYKWVDMNGKVHYSDSPPPSNIKSQKLREAEPAPSTPAEGAGTGGAAKAAAKSGPKTAAEQEQAFRKRQADAAKAREEDGKKQAAANDKAENCRRARAALTNFELSGRQTRIDEKGERVFMNEQEIAQEKARAQQIIATSCN